MKIEKEKPQQKGKGMNDNTRTGLKGVTFYISEDKHRLFKSRVALMGLNLNDILVPLLDKWLDGADNKNNCK